MTIGLPLLAMLLCTFVKHRYKSTVITIRSLADYVVQNRRYEIVEEEGCTIAKISSGLQILLFDTPIVLLPAVSALFYCRK